MRSDPIAAPRLALAAPRLALAAPRLALAAPRPALALQPGDNRGHVVIPLTRPFEHSIEDVLAHLLRILGTG
jgi:hypothetical protein